MITFFRGIFLLGSIAWFLVLGIILEMGMTLCRLTYPVKQRVRNQHASIRAKSLMKVFNFQIQLRGLEHLKALKTNALLVANHLSFWDAVILSGSLDRVTFITSVEVRDTPVIGMIARTVGAVFVERRSRAHLFQELNTVTQELLNGGSVVLFPEATSTDGSQILPFKRAFFKSAVEARKPVVPICLNYRFIDGKPLSPENRDYLFYYGNLNIVDQLYKVLKLRSVIVEVQVLDPLDPTEFSRQNMSLPAETQLSERSYQQIASQYVPIV